MHVIGILLASKTELTVSSERDVLARIEFDPGNEYREVQFIQRMLGLRSTACSLIEPKIHIYKFDHVGMYHQTNCSPWTVSQTQCAILLS